MSSFGGPPDASCGGGRYRIHVAPPFRLGSRSLRVHGTPGSVPAMSGRLPDGRILVVGAGTRPSPVPDAPVGNGRAIAVVAAREGADVVCADVDAGAAEVTADLVRAEGRAAVVAVGDVASADDCARLVEEAGPVTGVVLNVGIGLGGGLVGTTAGAVGPRVRGEPAQPLPAGAGGRAVAPGRRGDRVRQLGGRVAARIEAAGVRRVEGGDRRAVPSRRAGSGASGRAGQRGGARPHRHPARPGGDRRPAVAGEDAGAARPSGHRVGGGGRGGVPAVAGGQLHHRADPRRRRRPDL